MKNLEIKLGKIVLFFLVISLLFSFVISITNNNKLLSVILISPQYLILLLITFLTCYTVVSKKKIKLLNTISWILSIGVIVFTFIGILDFLIIQFSTYDTTLLRKLFAENNSIFGNPIILALFFFCNSSFLILQLKQSTHALWYFKASFYIQFFISSFVLILFIKNIDYTINPTFSSIPLVIPFCFIILSWIQLKLMNFQIWPFKFYNDQDISSKLRRTLLPVFLCFFIVYQLYNEHLNRFFQFKYTHSIFLIIGILTLIWLIIKITKNIGTDLEQSKLLYKGLFNNATIGLYQTTPNGKILSANPALVKMLKYHSLDELMLRDLKNGSYVDSGKRDEFKMLIDKYGEISNFESEWYTSNGSIISVKEGAYAFKNNKGKIVRFDGVVEDITHQKRDKESMLRLTKSIDNSGDIIINTDINGIITYVNQAFCNLYGYEKEEIIGKVTPRILKSGLQPEDLYQFYWDNLLQKKSVKGLQFVNKFKNGQLVNVEVSADPILNDQNQLVGFIGIQRNITQRVKQEKIQSIVLNIANVAQQTSDLGEIMKFIQKELGRIVDTSNFYVALYNEKEDSINLPYYSDEKDDLIDFPVGKTMTGLVIKQQKSLLLKVQDMVNLRAQKIIDAIGVDSKVWLGVPLKIKNKIMGVFVVQSYTNENAFSHDDLEILEIISHQIGISLERKLYEEQLLIAKVKAEESDRLKSAFLANMSHEIRTPMNAIMGFSDLLKNPELSGERQQKYVDIIKKSGSRLLTTINDIMDISKIEAGYMQLHNKELDINKEIEEIVLLFQPEIDKKNLTFTITNSLTEKEAKINSDQEKVYAVLVNLLKNAIKFTHQGTIELNCKLTNKEILFTIKDSGIGIPLDRQAHVFDRFVQADIEDKDVYEGSGLGLTICKSFLEMLGGKIWLESEVGVGSIFYFTIPYIPVHQQVENINENINENGRDEYLSKFPQLKILIAEDDLMAQTYLEEILIPYATEILIAEDGFKALEIAKQFKDIDLILMDIRMPGINGYEVTRRIREFNKEVIIIAQTANALVGDRETALAAGCNDYISKPIQQEELYKSIKNIFS